MNKKYDILAQKTKEIILSNYIENKGLSIKQIIEKLESMDSTESVLQQAKENASILIKAGLKNSYVIVRPNEIIIGDTKDINTMTNLWRWNNGGFGYSSTGINGPYGTAITMDGHIVASFITALEISGEMIKAGIIQSKTGKWQLNLDGETFNLGDKLTFDGTNLMFGSGVSLSWGQITSQPTIPTTAAQVGALPVGTFIPTQYTNAQALAAWVASGYKTYIDANGVYTGTLTANQVNAVDIKVDRLTASDGTNTLFISAGLMYFNSILYGISSDGTKAVAMFPEPGMVKATVVQAWNDNSTYTAPDGTLALGRIQQLNCVNAVIGNGGDGSGAIVVGYLSVTGTKSCLQITENYGSRLINAYETAEYYFGDIGSGIIDENGECFIGIDEIFQECVNVNIQYHVFTQVYNGSIISIDRQVGYFVVKGEPGTEFSWELKAKRLGYEHNRMELQEAKQDYVQSEITNELNYSEILENQLLGGA